MMPNLPRTLVSGGIAQRAYALLESQRSTKGTQVTSSLIRQYTTAQSKLLPCAYTTSTPRILRPSCSNASLFRNKQIPISKPINATSLRSFSSSPQSSFRSTISLKSDEEILNPYKAKREWPPDLSKLSSKQQFRLERKYRRRAKLKYERPVWSKWTKLVQWGLIGFVFVYCVFFMELGTGRANPFQGLRNFVFGFLDDVEDQQSKETGNNAKAN